MEKTLSNVQTPAKGSDMPSQVVGFRLSQTIAREVKSEAAKRGMKLNELFEEIWAQYKETIRPETKA